jgi:hypothetical protein
MPVGCNPDLPLLMRIDGLFEQALRQFATGSH